MPRCNVLAYAHSGRPRFVPAESNAGLRDPTADFRQDAGLACRRHNPSGSGGNWTLVGMGFADSMKKTTIAAIVIFWLGGATLAQALQHEIELNFVQAKSTVNFTLGDILHLVHGSFNVKRGGIRF